MTRLASRPPSPASNAEKASSSSHRALTSSRGLLPPSILEGGYDPAAGWVKRSTPGLTVLRRTATNVEGRQTLSSRLKAFQIHGAKAFRLQDLTIAVENAPAASAACADGRGISTYGLYLRDCGGYETVMLFSSEAFALAYEWTVTQNG